MTTDTAIRSTATIRAEDALAAIETCLVAVARDDSRPVLTGVHVRANDKGLTFAAADGFQLVTVNVPNPDAGEWAAILDGAALKSALTAIKALVTAGRRMSEANRTPITITIGDKAATLDAGASVITIPIVQGTYPDYDQLIPSLDCELGGKIAFNAGYVSKILAVAAKHSDTGLVRQRVQSPSAPMRFDWRAANSLGEVTWSAIAVLMPMSVKWESGDY